MKQAFYLSKKFFSSKNKSSSSYFISKVSSISIVASSFSLIVIMSIFTGFENLLSQMYSDFDPDIKVTSKNQTFFLKSDFNFGELDSSQIDYALTIENKVLAKYEDKQFLTNLKGVSKNYENVTRINGFVKEIFFDKNNSYNNVYLGLGLANNIGIQNESFNKTLSFFYPNFKTNTGFGVKPYNSDKAIVNKIFSFASDVDNDFTISEIEFAQNLFSKNGLISAIEIKVKNKKDLNTVVKYLKKKNENSFFIKDKFQQRDFLFKILNSEKLAVFFILVLIILLSSFTHIGFLNMFFIEKKLELSTLNKIGFSNKLIRHTLFFVSVKKFLRGLIIGVGLAHLFIFLQLKFSLIKMKDNLVVDSYPIIYEPLMVLKLIFVLILISIIYSWLPSKALSSNFLRKAEFWEFIFYAF